MANAGDEPACYQKQLMQFPCLEPAETEHAFLKNMLDS